MLDSKPFFNHIPLSNPCASLVFHPHSRILSFSNPTDCYRILLSHLCVVGLRRVVVRCPTLSPLSTTCRDSRLAPIVRDICPPTTQSAESPPTAITLASDMQTNGRETMWEKRKQLGHPEGTRGDYWKRWGISSCAGWISNNSFDSFQSFRTSSWKQKVVPVRESDCLLCLVETKCVYLIAISIFSSSMTIKTSSRWENHSAFDMSSSLDIRIKVISHSSSESIPSGVPYLGRCFGCLLCSCSCLRRSLFTSHLWIRDPDESFNSYWLVLLLRKLPTRERSKKYKSFSGFVEWHLHGYDGARDA